MIKRVLSVLFLCTSITSSLFAGNSLTGSREPAYPYVSGDGFRAFADHIFDETKKKLDVSAIKSGDTIFIKGDMLRRFCMRYQKTIKVPYILICHNSDENINATYVSYFDHPYLLACFAQNVDCDHPKLIPIPIGIQNRYNGRYGNPGLIEKALRKTKGVERKYVVCVNFANHFGRDYVLEKLEKLSNVIVYGVDQMQLGRKGYYSYLCDLAEYQFVPSPFGNGRDCHRTWEALYMGSVPIVQSSYLNPMYENLPIIVVDDWADLSDEYLRETFDQLSSKTYNMDKLFMPYWINYINAFRKEYR